MPTSASPPDAGIRVLRRALIRPLLLAACVALTGAAVQAGEGAAHGAAVARLRVSSENYVVPDIQLKRDSGQSVSLRRELDDGRPVLVNFIFTTCESTCPMSSQTFSLFQDRLGKERDTVHLVSISIDPEQDTPERLREYAKSFDAGPAWQYYTGTVEASVAAQRAFDVYRGDKMGHTPVTLLRAAPGQPWRRIVGFATPEDLMREYRAALHPGA